MSELNQKLSSSEIATMREKYWSELTDAEKIERMRIVFRQLPEALDAVAGQLSKLRSSFEDHFHSDGKVLTPVRQAYNGDSPVGYIGCTRRNANDPECYI